MPYPDTVRQAQAVPGSFFEALLSPVSPHVHANQTRACSRPHVLLCFPYFSQCAPGSPLICYSELGAGRESVLWSKQSYAITSEKEKKRK